MQNNSIIPPNGGTNNNVRYIASVNHSTTPSSYNKQNQQNMRGDTMNYFPKPSACAFQYSSANWQPVQSHPQLTAYPNFGSPPRTNHTHSLQSQQQYPIATGTTPTSASTSASVNHKFSFDQQSATKTSNFSPYHFPHSMPRSVDKNISINSNNPNNNNNNPNFHSNVVYQRNGALPAMPFQYPQLVPNYPNTFQNLQSNNANLLHNITPEQNKIFSQKINTLTPPKYPSNNSPSNKSHPPSVMNTSLDQNHNSQRFNQKTNNTPPKDPSNNNSSQQPITKSLLSPPPPPVPIPNQTLDGNEYDVAVYTCILKSCLKSQLGLLNHNNDTSTTTSTNNNIPPPPLSILSLSSESMTCLFSNIVRTILSHVELVRIPLQQQQQPLSSSPMMNEDDTILQPFIRNFLPNITQERLAVQCIHCRGSYFQNGQSQFVLHSLRGMIESLIDLSLHHCKYCKCRKRGGGDDDDTNLDPLPETSSSSSLSSLRSLEDCAARTELLLFSQHIIQKLRTEKLVDSLPPFELYHTNEVNWKKYDSDIEADIGSNIIDYELFDSCSSDTFDVDDLEH